MTKNGISKSKEKITNIRNKINNLNINNKNETVLVGIIEDIFLKLDRTIFSSYKKVAVSEFDKFLKILTVEKLKIKKESK